MRKFFVALVILLLCMGAEEALALSQDEALNWVYAQEGKYLDWDGYPASNPYQCVDLIKYYYDIFGFADYAMGNGCDYIGNALPPGWTRIQNYAEFVPEPGDIAVWTDAGWKNGHVAIILDADVHNFTSMDQNWPQGTQVTQVYHGYKYFWGVIRPSYTNHVPYGYLDYAEGGMGTIRIYGWAKDDDTPDEAVELHMYVGGPAGSGAPCYTGIMAGNYRDDVGAHGYDTIIHVNETGTQQVYVYAINRGEGNHNPLLTYCPKEVTIHSTVSYNANGGTNAPEAQIKYYGSGMTVTNDIPSRPGYTFVCWNDKADGSGGETLYPGGTWYGDRDITFYAIWTANKYTVIFEPNASGVTVNPTSKTVTFDSTYGDLPKPTRTGYTLDGWYTSASGGTKITSSTKVTTASNHPLYAHWTPNQYTVTFNPNADGVTVSPTSKTVTYDSTYGDLPAPTRNEYTLDGWYTYASGGTEITSSTKVTTASNHTLYAHWTPEIPPTPPTTAQLTATATAMQNDGTFTVTLGIQKNPGIAYIGIGSDAAEKGISIENVQAAGFAQNWSLSIGNKIIALYTTSEAKEDGSFLTLKMKSASVEEVELTFTVSECYNLIEQNVSVTGKSVQIKKNSVIPGDCNNDGVVDGRDLLRLARFVVGQDVTIDVAAADITGDGKIDGRDVLRLAKQLVM